MTVQEIVTLEMKKTIIELILQLILQNPLILSR